MAIYDRSEDAFKTVLILGIDAFLRKNSLQLREMEKLGWRYCVTVTDRSELSRINFQEFQHRHNLVQLRRFGIRRLLTLLGVLTRQYHHVELYPASRSAVIYPLALRLLGKRFVVIERGDLGVLSGRSRLQRLSLKISYRLAHQIWYKEPFMKDELRAYPDQRLRFVPNAVEIVGETYRHREIHFLWANRFTFWRRIDQFLAALKGADFANVITVIMGARGDHDEEKDSTVIPQLQTDPIPGVSVLGWGDPLPLMESSRYFVFLSKYIYGNHALLEAMARGNVPIVSRSEGVELIVQDGINGFIVEDSMESVRDTLLKCESLPDSSWQRLSEAARNTIVRMHSPTVWSARQTTLYQEMNSGSRI